MPESKDHPAPHEKPISLRPLSVEEALRRAMQAKPGHRPPDKGASRRPPEKTTRRDHD